jgi:hypothetical protein
MRLAWTLLCAALTLAGCLAQSPEELERLMKEDPEFKRMVAARDEVHDRIRLIKQDLLARKKTLDTQVGSLRAEYDAYAKAQNKKIEQSRAAIEANRSHLGTELELAVSALERKKTELTGYRKTLANVKRVLAESNGLTLSAAERQKWEERILMLSEKIRPLAEEVEELKLQIRLKKKKIGYLK